jgi:hypothetical protein
MTRLTLRHVRYAPGSLNAVAFRISLN